MFSFNIIFCDLQSIECELKTLNNLACITWRVDMKLLIIGLRKSDVLLALYNKALYQGKNYKLQPMVQKLVLMNGDGNSEAAEKIMAERMDKNNFYFDEVDLGAGPRRLKVDLGGFDFDPKSYDSDHGDGVAAAALSNLRNQMISITESAVTSSEKMLNVTFQNYYF